MDGTQYNPRTVEEIFRDFKGRRAGMIKALTSGLFCLYHFQFLHSEFLGFLPFFFKLIFYVVVLTLLNFLFQMLKNSTSSAILVRVSV